MTIYHVKSSASLEAFATSILGALGVTEYFEHESLNYPPDFTYFEGRASGARYTVCAEDSEDSAGFSDFQYWLVVYAAERSDEKNVRKFVEQTLSTEGYVFLAE